MGGPIRAGRKTLIFNKYSWTRFAKLVSLDYPWGSPFSRDRTHRKVDTVKELHAKLPVRFNRFVKRFFEKYSEYKNAPFFYAGDSSGIIFHPKSLR
jgi:carboxypeptidase C (cathepsin A)